MRLFKEIVRIFPNLDDNYLIAIFIGLTIHLKLQFTEKIPFLD